MVELYKLEIEVFKMYNDMKEKIKVGILPFPRAIHQGDRVQLGHYPTEGDSIDGYVFDGPRHGPLLSEGFMPPKSNDQSSDLLVQVCVDTEQEYNSVCRAAAYLKEKSERLIKKYDNTNTML